MIFGRKDPTTACPLVHMTGLFFVNYNIANLEKCFFERIIHENPTKRTVRLTFSIFREIIRCFSVEVFPFSFEVLTAATCNEVYERLAKDGLQPVTPADFVKSCVPFFVCSLLLLLRWSVFSVLFCAYSITSVLHFRTHYVYIYIHTVTFFFFFLSLIASFCFSCLCVCSCAFVHVVVIVFFVWKTVVASLDWMTRSHLVAWSISRWR